jgi:WD40 repeat protein
VIRELRAENDLSSQERLSIMRDIYERALIRSLTINDLEGLLNAPLVFNNWSTPILRGQVGEILAFLRDDQIPKLHEADREKFITEIARPLIRAKIKSKNSATIRWKAKQDSLRTLSTLIDLPRNAYVKNIAISRDGKILAAALSNVNIEIWSPKKLNHLYRINGLINPRNAMTLSSDGSHLYFDLLDDSVQAWNVSTQQPLPALKGYGENIRSLAVSSDGSQLATGLGNNTILLWNISSSSFNQSTVVKQFRLSAPQFLKFSFDGSLLYSSNGYFTQAWDIKSETVVQNLRVPNDFQLAAFALSPDLRFLYYSIWGDSNIYVWSFDAQKKIYHLPEHSEVVTTIAISPDGKHLYSGSPDRTFRQWDLSRLPLGEVKP